jgi:hypothetical protein
MGTPLHIEDVDIFENPDLAILDEARPDFPASTDQVVSEQGETVSLLGASRSLFTTPAELASTDIRKRKKWTESAARLSASRRPQVPVLLI